MRINWSAMFNWTVDLGGNKIENLWDPTTPNDAINKNYFDTNLAVWTNKIVLTCERNNPATWTYARWNGASSALWPVIPFDCKIINVWLTDEWATPTWSYELRVDSAPVFSFWSWWLPIVTNDIDIDVTAWQTIQFACTASWTWGARVWSITLEAITQGIRWEKWEQWQNAWITVSQNTATLPPANTYVAWTILRIDLWTKTGADQDEYITDWVSTWTFLGNVLGATWSGTQVEYAKVSFTNSNTVNDWAWTVLNTFDSTIFESTVWLTTVISWWVTISQTWVYECTFSALYTSTVARVNPSAFFTVDWVAQINRSASAYIRASSSHNTSSNTLSELIQINAGQVLWITHDPAGFTPWTVQMLWASTSLSITKVW